VWVGVWVGGWVGNCNSVCVSCLVLSSSSSPSSFSLSSSFEGRAPRVSRHPAPHARYRPIPPPAVSRGGAGHPARGRPAKPPPSRRGWGPPAATLHRAMHARLGATDVFGCRGRSGNERAWTGAALQGPPIRETPRAPPLTYPGYRGTPCAWLAKAGFAHGAPNLVVNKTQPQRTRSPRLSRRGNTAPLHQPPSQPQR
jgi:hypothetical protein